MDELNVISKEEFLLRRSIREQEKLNEKRQALLSRVIDTLSRGEQHILGVPDDEKVISYIVEQMEAVGWKVEVRRAEYMQTNPRTRNKHKKTNITLHFS